LTISLIILLIAISVTLLPYLKFFRKLIGGYWVLQDLNLMSLWVRSKKFDPSNKQHEFYYLFKEVDIKNTNFVILHYLTGADIYFRYMHDVGMKHGIFTLQTYNRTIKLSDDIFNIKEYDYKFIKKYYDNYSIKLFNLKKHLKFYD